MGGFGRAGALLAIAAILSAALLLWAVGDPIFAASFAAGLIGAGVLLFMRPGRGNEASEPLPVGIDVALLRAIIDQVPGAAALTDASGAMRCANPSYSEWFGGIDSPGSLIFDEGAARLAVAEQEARSTGHAAVEELSFRGTRLRLELRRAGADGAWLLWTFSRAAEVDLAREARRLIEGDAGRRVGEAGVMAVLADAGGKLISANPAFAARALGDPGQPAVGSSLISLITADAQGRFCFVAEGEKGSPLRILQVPLADAADAPTLFVLLDETAGRLLCCRRLARLCG